MPLENAIEDLEETIVITRTISAFCFLVIVAPIVFIGGIPFQLLILAITFFGLKELMNINEKKHYSFLIRLLSYFSLASLLFMKVHAFYFDIRFLSGYLLLFLLPLLYYHDVNTYEIEDAFYLLGCVLLLGVSGNLVFSYRKISLELFLYLSSVAVFTDVFAYFTGSIFGKTKLLESVSPKKTIEGMLGGTFIGTIVPAYYYFFCISSNSFIKVFFVTLFLSLMGQFGDLVFSSIKRYFKKKDFSNLIPGHGGILDRFDSLIFIVLSFMFLIHYL